MTPVRTHGLDCIGVPTMILTSLNKMKIVQSGGHDHMGFRNIIIHVLTGLSIIMSITVSKVTAKVHKYDCKGIKTLHKLEITLKSIRYNKTGYIGTSIY